ncbi:MAG: acyl carrier protein [Treponema sp.]|nr:acyl carrier protein [Treponema sp.]
MTNEELFSKLQDILVNEFDLEKEQVTLEANIVDDLDLDSIDAVELIVKMKPYLNSKIEPDAFKSVRTLQDVVQILAPLAK